MNIFSTNYDLAIETLCMQNDKKYADGFGPTWDPNEFHKPEIDVRLYKLHGSVRWYRTEEADYGSSKVRIKGIKIILDTDQEAVPLILYPGRKLEYIEPLFDMLAEFKKQLDHAKYLFVIGYSFKDDHLAKILRYAAKTSPNLVVFLISPSAHKIYNKILKRHIDIDFPHGVMFENFDKRSFNADKPSKLNGRVICLPYGIEKIANLLNPIYLQNLKDGQSYELGEEFEDNNSQRTGSVTR